MRAPSSVSLLFPLRALAWSLVLFATFRNPWVETELIVPLTRLQGAAAEFYAGQPSAPIQVTSACSGADVMAMCVGAILAAPLSRMRRVVGAVGGLTLILLLNTARIASLGAVASTPDLFNALHLQVWPAILMTSVLGYVLFWLSLGTRPRESGEGVGPRWAFASAVCLVLFALCGPWIASSSSLIALGGFTARSAAALLNTLGVEANALGNVMTTGRGAFEVTPECLATVFVPLYIAAAVSLPLSVVARLIALALAPTFFLVLAIVRLMLLALPPVLVGSPLFWVHGFHQCVCALLVVAWLSARRDRDGRTGWSSGPGRAPLALSVALFVVMVLQNAATGALLGLARLTRTWAPNVLTDLSFIGDDQGALLMLPGFQLGFVVAMALAQRFDWRETARALYALLLSQLLLLIFLGESVARSGAFPHALLIRGVALLVPIALVFLSRGGWSLVSPPRQPALAWVSHGAR